MKCYLTECEKESYPGSYWCTKTHQLAWQEDNYGSTAERKIPKTIEQIQEGLKRMKEQSKTI